VVRQAHIARGARQGEGGVKFDDAGGAAEDVRVDG
jgi:hypothetical protein